MMQSTDKHVFALYYANTTNSFKNRKTPFLCDLADDQLTHRIKNVLRLEPGEHCIVFDNEHNALLRLVSFNKKKCTAEILHISSNELITPEITFLLPVLKKDALEAAVYSLTELGVTTIQLVMTDKVQRKWAGQSEQERLTKIIHTAAEQSKHFRASVLHEPISLAQAVKQYNAISRKFYADPSGAYAHDVFKQAAKDDDAYLLMVGPEGDLTQHEKKLLQENDFVFCALTPTVLRSVHAVALFAGMVRSLARKA